MAPFGDTAAALRLDTIVASAPRGFRELAVAIAGLNLFPERLPKGLTRSADAVTRPALKGIKCATKLQSV